MASGVHIVHARGAGLQEGSLLVVVSAPWPALALPPRSRGLKLDADEARSARPHAWGGSGAMSARPPNAPRRAPTHASVPLPAPEAAPALGLFVVPSRVLPLGNGWTAELNVVAKGKDDLPMPVASAVEVRLTADLGNLTPDHVNIPQGNSLATERVSLHSDRAGTDKVSAFSSLGVFASPPVEYALAPPERLRVEANPAYVVNSGRSPIAVAGVSSTDRGGPPRTRTPTCRCC